MLKPPFRLMCLPLGALALVGCVSPPPPPLVISVPPPLNEPCPRSGNPAKVETVGDLAAFSLVQERDLAVCEARRAALQSLVVAHAAVVTPKRAWWHLW